MRAVEGSQGSFRKLSGASHGLVWAQAGVKGVFSLRHLGFVWFQVRGLRKGIGESRQRRGDVVGPGPYKLLGHRGEGKGIRHFIRVPTLCRPHV